MSRRLWIPAAVLLAITAGTVADRRPVRAPVAAGEYQVLSADLHLHSGLGSGGTLTPWGLVNEALRQGLDVVALTGHNETWDGRVARAFSRLAGGPLVLTGEEITSATQDLVAVGVRETISPSLPLRAQIEEIHRQGGVAIAAHPIARFHEPYRASGALHMLDGTEVCHPVMWERAGAGEQLAAFAAATNAAPIGSSDFHSSGRIGSCRTFLFVKNTTERDVLDAIRERRTVVYGLNGRVFGDPALVAMAEQAGLRAVAASYTRSRGTVLDWISRLAAGAALVGMALATRPRSTPPGGGRRGYAPNGPARRP